MPCIVPNIALSFSTLFLKITYSFTLVVFNAQYAHELLTSECCHYQTHISQSSQACYRGYRVRQRIASALRAVNYYDDDDDDDDDFNYDEEVDLSAFDYDSGLLDEGWTPTDTPQLPSR